MFNGLVNGHAWMVVKFKYLCILYMHFRAYLCQQLSLLKLMATKGYVRKTPYEESYHTKITFVIKLESKFN